MLEVFCDLAEFTWLESELMFAWIAPGSRSTASLIAATRPSPISCLNSSSALNPLLSASNESIRYRKCRMVSVEIGLQLGRARTLNFFDPSRDHVVCPRFEASPRTSRLRLDHQPKDHQQQRTEDCKPAQPECCRCSRRNRSHRILHPLHDIHVSRLRCVLRWLGQFLKGLSKSRYRALKVEQRHH